MAEAYDSIGEAMYAATDHDAASRPAPAGIAGMGDTGITYEFVLDEGDGPALERAIRAAAEAHGVKITDAWQFDPE